MRSGRKELCFAGNKMDGFMMVIVNLNVYYELN